jgi:hypothetical protein
MVNTEHLKFLQTIITEINNNNISGSIVECGVWKGGCCMWMLDCQKKIDMLRSFYFYDTFDGMTFPDSDKDAPEAVKTFNSIKTGEYARNYDKWHSEKKWAYAPFEIVKKNIEKIKYDDSKITYVKGDVCTTLDTIFPSSISILRLDTDWYNSTKKELDVLFPLVTKNGYIIVDDYYAWKGSRVATDEFLQDKKDKITIIDKKLTGNIFVFRKNN